MKWIWNKKRNKKINIDNGFYFSIESSASNEFVKGPYVVYFGERHLIKDNFMNGSDAIDYIDSLTK